MRDLLGKHVVAVHAHPDDEAIWTGGLLAHLANRGAEVTVITCTLGEHGEVIGEPLQGLVADAADQLGGFRIAEWRASLDRLGVRGTFLGGAGRWRDSGMIGDPANEHERAFVSSGEPAVAALSEQFARLQPDLVITYGPDGGYGHPDHVRAHNITHEAAKRVPVPRIIWAVTQREALERGLEAIEDVPEGWRRALEGEIACVEDTDIAVALDPRAWTAKLEAMKAHATQLWIADGTTSATNPHAAVAKVSDLAAAPAVFALSNLIAQPLLNVEHYQLGAGAPFEGSDVMAGI